MDEKEKYQEIESKIFNRDQLKILHFIALKGEVPCFSLRNEFNLSEPSLNYLLKQLSGNGMLIKTEKNGDCYYSVNTTEFLNQLNRMTSRVKFMINECNFLLGNTTL